MNLTPFGENDPAFGGQAGYWLPPLEQLASPSSKESPMTKFVSNFMSDESGATAIEYGLIAALIAVVIISAVTALGTTIKTKFNSVVTGMGGTAGA
jgi:pilus assembly protein Flp/PilA